MASLTRRVAVPLLALLLALLLAVGLAGCTRDHGDGATGAEAGSAASHGAGGQQPPDARMLAIRTAIDMINETANGPVEAQRAVFERLAAPTETEDQRDCPEASMTLSFEPAYSDLRRDAIATRKETSANGAAYLLPSFISMYRGGRMVGSDMVTLHVWIAEGQARTSALCVA